MSTFLTAEPLTRTPRLHHGFFTRLGGVSEGLFASLNCGLGSGDELEKVRENRRRAADVLALAPEYLLTAYQVHSAEVAVVERPWSHEERPKVDALVTNRPGIGLGVLSADCGPLLFADAEARVIGAAHAGWRGALSGVAEATVEAMVSLGAERARIAAVLGPMIAQPSYEVGPEFPSPFLAADPDNAAFFEAAPRAGHFHFDLAGFILRKLEALGLAGVSRVEGDTCADDAQFFSYRRACLKKEQDYGRGLSAIALSD